MLICKKGTFSRDGFTRVDVDREMFLLQNVFDENKSWYLDENLRLNGIDPSTINKEDEDFVESNLMHAVNGRFFGNLFGLNLYSGEKVAWYFGALGNEVDIHTGKVMFSSILSPFPFSFKNLLYWLFHLCFSIFISKFDIFSCIFLSIKKYS